MVLVCHVSLSRKMIEIRTLNMKYFHCPKLYFFIELPDWADKHIPSKTSRSVSSVPLITPAIRRKIRR